MNETSVNPCNHNEILLTNKDRVIPLDVRKMQGGAREVVDYVTSQMDTNSEVEPDEREGRRSNHQAG